ncbi:MAG: hypothetical protein RI991_907 [Bacteroidota bacterium]
MKKLISNRLLFYTCWLLLSLVQAAGTELFDDEAYYWVYAQFLDWGYFDHPPMIAIMIKAGTMLFPGELGVRFFVVIMGTATLYIIEKLTRPKDLQLFYVIVLNIAVLQIGSIIAFPDIPLLFFTALFFWVYKLFTEKQNWINALLLSIVIALLLYSKYHGLLIIFVTLISNLKMLKKPLTWLVISLSFFFYMPHIIWQIQHGLPSYYYHLFERVSPPYSISFISDYVAGQLLLAGPLLGWLMIWSAFKHKPIDLTQKAMKWSLGFVYILFFISSFKTRTEANWTLPLIVPIIVLAYQYLETQEKLKRWFYSVLPVSLVLILVMRIFMLLDTPFIKNFPKDEYHFNKTWTSAIKEKANGMPVVFTNSYQRASKYWFYTGDTAFSLNTHLYRRSNYNIWPLELQLQQKPVFIVGSKGTAGLSDSLISGNKSFSVGADSAFQSYSHIVLKQLGSKVAAKSRSISVTLQVSAPSDALLKDAELHQTEIILILYPGNKQLPWLIPTGKKLVLSNTNEVKINLVIPELDDKNYQIRWGLQGSYEEPSINSSVYTLVNELY